MPPGIGKPDACTRPVIDEMSQVVTTVGGTVVVGAVTSPSGDIIGMGGTLPMSSVNVSPGTTASGITTSPNSSKEVVDMTETERDTIAEVSSPETRTKEELEKTFVKLKMNIGGKKRSPCWTSGVCKLISVTKHGLELIKTEAGESRGKGRQLIKVG
jgi:hypothetical protein